MADKVKFVKTTLAQYQSLTVYDKGTIYFLTDGGGLYVGNEPIVDTNDISASVSAITPQVFTVYDETGLSAVDDLFASISAAQNAKELKEGDVFIVTAGAISSKSAYTYDNGWIACNGNVDASKVIMTSDLSLAGSYTQVGNIRIEDGILSAAGKSVVDIFTDIFDQTVDPVQGTAPSITITQANATAYDVGTTRTPTFTCTFTQGKYSTPWNNRTIDDGTSLNVASLSVEIYDGDSLLSTVVGQTSITCPQITVGDDTNYRARIIGAKFNDGSIPKNNKNEDCPEVQRKAGNITQGIDRYTTPITGYRPWFMYIGESLATIDSAFIRSSTNKGQTVSNQNFVTIPEGTKRVMVAVPQASSKQLTSVVDQDGFQMELINDAAAHTTVVEVAGSGTYSTTKPYNVWYHDMENGRIASRYNFTFG